MPIFGLVLSKIESFSVEGEPATTCAMLEHAIEPLSLSLSSSIATTLSKYRFL